MNKYTSVIGITALSLLTITACSAITGKDSASTIVSDQALAYAEINFDPSTSQKAEFIKINGFLKTLEGESEDKLVGADMKQTIFNAATGNSIDYKEIASFTGDNLAIALLPDNNGDTTPELFSIYNITDDKKAKQYDATSEHVQVVEDFLVISIKESDLSAFSLPYKPLSDNETYKNDLDALGGKDNIATVWTNLNDTKLGSLDSLTSDLSAYTDMFGVSLPESEPTPFTFRAGSTIRLADGAIKFESEVFESTVDGLQDKDFTLSPINGSLSKHPADTIIALGMGKASIQAQEKFIQELIDKEELEDSETLRQFVNSNLSISLNKDLVITLIIDETELSKENITEIFTPLGITDIQDVENGTAVHLKLSEALFGEESTLPTLGGYDHSSLIANNTSGFALAADIKALENAILELENKYSNVSENEPQPENNEHPFHSVGVSLYKNPENGNLHLTTTINIK